MKRLSKISTVQCLDFKQSLYKFKSNKLELLQKKQNSKICKSNRFSKKRAIRFHDSWKGYRWTQWNVSRKLSIYSESENYTIKCIKWNNLITIKSNNCSGSSLVPPVATVTSEFSKLNLIVGRVISLRS